MGGGGGGDESLKICEGAIRALKWLRDPFIRMNLMTGESMIRYVLAVEQYEKYHVKGFYEEMVSAKDQFFENKNLRVQYMDEMNELMELGDEMITVISEQENRRESHDRIMNEVFNKASAMYWNDCLRDFDEEWSPWTSSLKDKSQYIISLHRDRIGRRMVMKRGSEVYDHSDAAYWGGRGREQSEYDQLLDSNAETGTASSTGSLPEAAASTSSTSFLKNTLEITRPKMSRLRSENDWDEKEGGSDGDGDDVDVDIEETSVPIHSKPDKGLVRFPFQQVEKKKPLWASTFVWQSDEREVFTVDVTQIMTEQALSGTLLLTNKSLYFHPKKRIGGFATNPDEFHNKRWKLEKLVEVYGRRYLLQNCGVELFFLDSPEFFIAFNTTHELHKFFRFLRKLMNKNLITGSSLSPMHIYQISPWTELWKKRLISNYEYLMRLNQIGGRSYNDITQYPVMPWVLKDYQSTQLDLNNEEIYRDLSKPIGALNEQRLREILERYKSFGDDYDMPGFMYGSHYSSAGVILHFLVRQEPFTSMAITLQAGRFDCPDRLFFNIKETWKCCNTSLSDVKELLPELFFLPEMFINTNTLPLGELQDDRGVVNHVLLPPWCQSNPYEFIRLHREALESDYVSDHLHEWIDLIFGFKQTGKAAVDACNVFHYLTYENAIDIESIQDPLTKNATKAQVTHFGQTPSQLLTKEHPKRLPKEECQLPFTTNFKTLPKLRCFTPSKQFCSPVLGSPGGDQQQHGAIVRIQGNQEKLLVFHSDFTIATYRWNTYPDSSSAEGGYPFTLKPDKIKSFPFSPLMVFPYTSTSSLNEQRLRDIRLDEATAAANASTTSYFGLFTLSNSGSSPTRTPTKTSPDTPPSVPPSPSLTVTAALFPPVDDSPEEAIEEAPVPSHQPQSLMKLVQDKRIQKKNVIFRLAESTSYDRLLTCGYWDGHLKAHGLDTFREIATSPGGHIGGINCVDMSDEEKALVITGGDDCTCRVWVLENPALVASLTVDQEMHSHILNTATDPSSISSASSPPSATNTATTTTTATTALSGNSMSALENKFGNPGSLKMIHVLWGHNSPVTALSYSNFHDLILSGSESGLLCVHTARKGEYIRSIYSLMAAQDQPLADLRPFCQGEGCAIDQVEISTSGYLYAYCATNLTLSVFWINGQFLHRVTLATRSPSFPFRSSRSLHLTSPDVSRRMECLLLNSAGSMLFCGGSDGRIVIRQAWDLQEVETSIHLPDHGAITSMILQAGNPSLSSPLLLFCPL
jgi:WD40 repeat protein